MDRKRFEFVCRESAAGNDAVVINREVHGVVDHCSGDHLLVRTSEGAQGCWDYRDCDELYRSKDEFPWR